MKKATSTNSDHEWQQPIEVSTKPHIRPDGELVRVTLTQGEVEISLTAEQGRSLIKALQAYLP